MDVGRIMVEQSGAGGVSLSEVSVRPVAGDEERDRLMDERHYLGFPVSVQRRRAACRPNRGRTLAGAVGADGFAAGFALA